MSYRLSDAAALARMVRYASGVLGVRMAADREYTGQELLELCRLSGLEYTLAEYQRIAQELIASGMLEVV
ncbi:hypothetical protein KKE60_05245 [Patescibacteria group bacterium]|nr:hypothetical protein [Patescibacteria group bacterium]